MQNFLFLIWKFFVLCTSKYILNTFKKCSFTLKLYHFHVTIDFGIAFGTLYSEPPFLLVHAKSADSTPFLLLCTLYCIAVFPSPIVILLHISIGRVLQFRYISIPNWTTAASNYFYHKNF